MRTSACRKLEQEGERTEWAQSTSAEPDVGRGSTGAHSSRGSGESSPSSFSAFHAIMSCPPCFVVGAHAFGEWRCKKAFRPLPLCC